MQLRYREAGETIGTDATMARAGELTWIVLALAAAVAASGARADETAEIERGRALAERMCATCHLNPGQGDKAAAAAVPGFTAVANRAGQSFDGIVAWLRSVPKTMPNHHLSSGEMEALASYILSLRVPDTADKM